MVMNQIFKIIRGAVPKLFENHYGIDFCAFDKGLVKEQGEAKVMKIRDKVYFTFCAQKHQGKFLIA